MSDFPEFMSWMVWVNFVLLATSCLLQIGLFVRGSRLFQETRDLLQIVKRCQSIAIRQQEVATRLVSDVPDAVRSVIKESESGVLGRGRNGGGPCPE